MKVDPMADYWKARYIETMLTVHETSSSPMRSTYLQLAEHYRAMARCAERRPLVWN